jgi:hypothetical protein
MRVKGLDKQQPAFPLMVVSRIFRTFIFDSPSI